MIKVDAAKDVAGQELGKGDTVATVSGDMTGRVCDLAVEGGAQFVRLRPLHMPYGKGIWHASDQVVRVAVGRRREASRPKPTARKAPPNAPETASNASQTPPTTRKAASNAPQTGAISEGATARPARPRKGAVNRASRSGSRRTSRAAPRRSPARKK